MPAATLERHHGRSPAYGIDVPAGAELGDADGLLLTVVQPQGDGPARQFKPNLTLVAEPLPPGMDLEAYTDGSLATESEMFPGWRLIDRATAPVGELTGVRTLATYLASAVNGLDFGRDLSVTIEQWRVVHEGRGWIVTASAETPDYHLTCDLWAACAESLRPGERG
jgi:hypothetical protein